MKRLAVLAAALITLSASASWAQQGGMGGMDMKDKERAGMDMSKCQEMMDKGMKDMDMPKECKEMMDKRGKDGKAKGPAKGKSTATPKAGGKKSQAASHKGSGTVTNVDTAGGKVTIAHGPVPTIKWPAMTMTFSVPDKALLDHVHEGGKVEFEFVQKGPDYVITKIH